MLRVRAAILPCRVSRSVGTGGVVTRRRPVPCLCAIVWGYAPWSPCRLGPTAPTALAAVTATASRTLTTKGLSGDAWRQTHVLHSESVLSLCSELRHSSLQGQGSLLLAVVEDIHDQPSYDGYAGANSAAFAEFGEQLTVLCRQYARDMDRFQVLYCTARIGAGAVDRMPVVFCDSMALAEYVTSDAYLTNNVFQRHSSSGHCNAYVCTGINPTWLAGFRGQVAAAPTPTFLVFECYEAGSAAATLEEALAAAGARLVFAPGRHAVPWLHVLEGTLPHHVALYRLPSWGEASTLARACGMALSAFEAGGGSGRLIAFSS